MSILYISHRAIHPIIDFFLYSAVYLHAKGNNLEKVFCYLNLFSMI